MKKIILFLTLFVFSLISNANQSEIELPQLKISKLSENIYIANFSDEIFVFKLCEQNNFINYKFRNSEIKMNIHKNDNDTDTDLVSVDFLYNKQDSKTYYSNDNLQKISLPPNYDQSFFTFFKISKNESVVFKLIK